MNQFEIWKLDYSLASKEGTFRNLESQDIPHLLPYCQIPIPFLLK